ncbi:unnamed protein product [Callosobruchus maculatus]|uniref:Secreted protein n=1 Tax=Callosobruchus maculatus TaxID=64391 RepID=A0A653DMB1_CALMS|nr:unnamed protein product [Callosobruchus maculatus]
MYNREILLMFLILLTTSRASPQRALNASWLPSGQRPSPSPSSPHLQSTPDRQDLWGATTEGVLGVVQAGGQSTATPAAEAAASAGNYLGGRSRRESRRSRRKFRVYPVLCG